MKGDRGGGGISNPNKTKYSTYVLEQVFNKHLKGWGREKE